MRTRAFLARSLMPLTTTLVVLGAAALTGFVPGCADDHAGMHEHEHAAGLEAPTGLEAMLVEGGVHLTWQDNSASEAEFMILRKTGAADYAALATTAPNATAYHDATVVAGATYTYAVHAMTATAESPLSNEVTVSVP